MVKLRDLIGEIGSLGFMTQSCHGWLLEDPQTWGKKIDFAFMSSPIFRIIGRGEIFFYNFYIY